MQIRLLLLVIALKACSDEKDILKDIFLEKEKVKHRIINKKQLETFSSMALWSQNG